MNAVRVHVADLAARIRALGWSVEIDFCEDASWHLLLRRSPTEKFHVVKGQGTEDDMIYDPPFGVVFRGVTSEGLLAKLAEYVEV